VPRGQEAAAAQREASGQPAGGAASGGASSSSSLAIRQEGRDQSVYLDSFVTEEVPGPENEKNELSTQYRKCDFSLPVLVPLLEMGPPFKTVQVKTGTSSFGGRKNFTGQTALFPSHILRKMQKQKNSQGSRMETMVAAGHGLYCHLWAVRGARYNQRRVLIGS